MLWWLVASSAGAGTRAELLRAIRSEPRNAQQLSEAVGIDYTTARHHLKVLTANHLVEAIGPRYGQVYSVAPTLEARWDEFERITARRRSRG